MVREGKGSAASILAHHGSDAEPGQPDAGVCLCYGGIVPHLNLAQENAGVGVPGELQLPIEPWDVIGKDYAAGRCREQEGAPVYGCHLRVRHGCVARSEIDALLVIDVPADKAPYAFPAADRVVGDGRARMLLFIDCEPLFVEDGRERRACPAQIDGGAGCRAACRVLSPPWEQAAATKAARKQTMQSRRQESDKTLLNRMSRLMFCPHQLNSPLIYSFVCFSLGALKTCCDSPNSTR